MKILAIRYTKSGEPDRVIVRVVRGLDRDLTIRLPWSETRTYIRLAQAIAAKLDGLNPAGVTTAVKRRANEELQKVKERDRSVRRARENKDERSARGLKRGRQPGAVNRRTKEKDTLRERIREIWHDDENEILNPVEAIRNELRAFCERSGMTLMPDTDRYVSKFLLDKIATARFASDEDRAIDWVLANTLRTPA